MADELRRLLRCGATTERSQQISDRKFLLAHFFYPRHFSIMISMPEKKNSCEGRGWGEGGGWNDLIWVARHNIDPLIYLVWFRHNMI